MSGTTVVETQPEMDLVGSNKIENCKSVSNKYCFLLPDQKAIEGKPISSNQIYRVHVPDGLSMESVHIIQPFHGFHPFIVPVTPPLLKLKPDPSITTHQPFPSQSISNGSPLN